jgi:virginiamycin B lyase
MRRHFWLLFSAVAMGALGLCGSASAQAQAPLIRGTIVRSFPERTTGNSVAIGPDGTPWFGVAVQEKGMSLGTFTGGQLTTEELRAKPVPAETSALEFDSQGDLWFTAWTERGKAIWRRGPDGTLTEFSLPHGEGVNSLAFDPEGDVWFTRGSYGKGSVAAIGRMTPSGAVDEFPLEAGSQPTSIVAGPDGALWFTELEAGKVGRITTRGEVQLFPLAAGAHPQQIVAGPDGALWFGENAQPRPHGKFSDRIGRITTDGQVSELPIPFGRGTVRLAADPRGVVWFTTTEGEISSVAPSGNVGARGCAGSCGDLIEGLALAPDGALWFATGHASCSGCGGGADLILQNEGTTVGEIPATALAPADPDGPPATDPYAGGVVPAKPVARTLRPYGVNGTSAIVDGFINARGYPATYRFKWGKTKRYGHLAPDESPEEPVSPDQEGEEIEEVIGGLCPKTTYHFEIVAYGPGGRALGGDRTFRTTAAKHRPKRCSKR